MKATKQLEIFFSTLGLLVIPFMRLIITVIVLYVYSTNAPIVNPIVVWTITISGIIWTFHFYYSEYRINRLEKKMQNSYYRERKLKGGVENEIKKTHRIR